MPVECTEHRQLEIKLVEQGRAHYLPELTPNCRWEWVPVDTMETIKESDEDDGIMLLRNIFS